jgi:hypothetical protein
MNRTIYFLVVFLFISTSGRQAFAADDAAVAGRSILEKYRDAVVSVQMVIKEGMSFGGMSAHEYESTTDAIGVVIDPSGLTVLSLSQTNPSGMLSDLLSGSGSADSLEMKSELSDVQIVLSDGTEIPAKIVLRDKDLDIAFARPTEKRDEPFVSIDLSDGASPQILDEVIVLKRMGRIANRTPRVSLARVEAVVEKPRTFYVLEEGEGSLGSPVFDLSGEPVGVLFYRKLKTGGGMSIASLLSSSDGFGMLTIVLPGADIQEVAAQAPEVEE